MNKIVVRIIAGHPFEIRRRAGFSFTKAPSVAVVTDDELEIIKGDSCIMIVTRGNGIVQGLANPAIHADPSRVCEASEPTTDEQLAALDPIEPEASEPSVNDIVLDAETAPLAPEGDESDVPPEDDKKEAIDFEALTIPKIVDYIESKGKLAGQDFNPKALKDDLIALAQSL